MRIWSLSLLNFQFNKIHETISDLAGTMLTMFLLTLHII
jgi:hypothetical protein